MCSPTSCRHVAHRDVLVMTVAGFAGHRRRACSCAGASRASAAAARNNNSNGVPFLVIWLVSLVVYADLASC